MRILVTTAGVLPPEPAADLVEALIGDSGSVTVMNVVQTPNDFLEELAADDRGPFNPSPDELSGPPGQTPAERYVHERGSKMVAPVVAALRTRHLEPRTKFVEADEVADAIIRTAEEMAADLVVLGTTRRLFAGTSWTSISMKVTAEAKVPLLLIPEPAPPTHPSRSGRK